MPIFLLLLTGVVIVGNLWLARVELENGLESAALAAVNEWGRAGGGPTEAARLVGVAYAASNTIAGDSIEIVTNLDPVPSGDNPNQNLDCRFGKPDLVNGLPPTGSLIFGAVFEEENPLDPDGHPLIVFNAGIAGGCGSGTVFLDIFKTDGGNSTDPRMIGIFFDDGQAAVSIQSVSLQLPTLFTNGGNPVNSQSQPYWDALKLPSVSIREDNIDPDELNRFNTDPDPNNDILEPYDVRGVDWRPIDPSPGEITVDNQQQVQSSAVWTNYPNATTGNPHGDIWFTFSGEIVSKQGNVLDDRWRTLTINFTPGVFTSTGDPHTTDFVRFGGAFNNMQPDTPQGDNNDGDAFGILGVRLLITFHDSSDGTTSQAGGRFFNVDRDGDGQFDDGWSEANILGTGGGLPAVRAQAIHPVRNPISRLCGRPFGRYFVPVKTTAVYDCALGRSRLIRIDKFICPGPEENP